MYKKNIIFSLLLSSIFLVSCTNYFSSGTTSDKTNTGTTNTNSVKNGTGGWLKKESNKLSKEQLLTKNLIKLDINVLKNLDCSKYLSGASIFEIKKCESSKKRILEREERHNTNKKPNRKIQK